MVLVAGLIVALVALAALQYRWIARVSEAERDRLKASLDSAAERFCADFDRELVRTSRSFEVAEDLGDADLERDLVDRLARWRSTAAGPKLVRELLVVTRLERGEVELRRLDEPAGRLVPGSWEPDLESVRRIFEARGRVPLLDERLPGLVLAPRNARPPRQDGTEKAERGPAPRGEEPGGGADRRPPRHHVVVRLDLEYLGKEMLPRLAEREFGGREGLAYAVTVAVAADPRVVIFRGGPRVEDATARTADAVRNLFALQRPGDEPDPGRWVVAVHHPAGSLEDAVTGARRRNLAISLAVLVLLGAAVVVLVSSTRRAQRLARQQMDFVAGVSHELRTPLTAMRSAGQNLADGIVSDPEKVKKYGALIEREGRRLTEMVGRVLTFAGIQSGAQTFQAEPVDVASLVDGVLADCRWVLDEKRVAVERDVAEGLPEVRGDAAALRQALGNLVDNALKYGGSARWIGVGARLAATSGGEEVLLSVSDHGIGIRRSDLPHLFDPFFRSADPSAAGIPGSGVGLAVVRGIVEAHGGRVTAESVPGQGSTFTVHLPTAAGKGRGA